MADTCKYGHDVTKPNSRDASGYCRLCRKNRNQREYLKLKAAADVVEVFRAAGIPVGDGDVHELARQLVKNHPID